MVKHPSNSTALARLQVYSSNKASLGTPLVIVDDSHIALKINLKIFFFIFKTKLDIRLSLHKIMMSSQAFDLITPAF